MDRSRGAAYHRRAGGLRFILSGNALTAELLERPNATRYNERTGKQLTGIDGLSISGAAQHDLGAAGHHLLSCSAGSWPHSLICLPIKITEELNRQGLSLLSLLG